MSQDPHEEIAQEIRRRVDRLVNQAEAKMQYILDLQGNPIRDLRDVETLTRVVNAHGVLFGELIRTVGAVGVIAAESLSTQGKLIQAMNRLTDHVGRLADNAGNLDHALDRVANDLTRLMEEVDERTLVIPDTPRDV